jgi:hypothetical protein
MITSSVWLMRYYVKRVVDEIVRDTAVPTKGVEEATDV